MNGVELFKFNKSGQFFIVCFYSPSATFWSVYAVVVGKRDV